MPDPAPSASGLTTPAGLAEADQALQEASDNLRAATAALVDAVLDNVAVIQPRTVGRDLSTKATQALRSMLAYEVARR